MTKTRAQRQRRSNRADEQLAAAMASFSLNYGRDETKLEKWQLLCDDCGVGRVGSITKCKTVNMSSFNRYLASLLKKVSYCAQ